MSDGHIFISYARADGRDYARRIDDDLRAAGFRTWRDTRDIDPYQDFSAELETAIEHASHVVCCVTPDVRRDDSFVRREIGYSLRLKKPIVPLIFQGTLPPIQIVNVTDVDFTRQPWPQATGTLVERLHRGDDRTYEQVRLPDDPYREYLESLYDQIVKYLNLTVFSLITLKSESTPEAVERPRSLPMTFFAMAGVEDKVDEKTQFNNFHEAYEKYGGRVLLLGEPGAGKTTTLFAFAREKVAERLADPTKPLPILVPIATWDAQKQTPLVEWLAEQVPALKREELTHLLKNGKTLLLLDGLDELGSEGGDGSLEDFYDPRLRFIEQVDRLLPQSPFLIVTSRLKDYKEIGVKISLRGSITLHPLNDIQMQEYLRELPDLWLALKSDDELRKVARTPLLLSIFTFTFQGLTNELKGMRDLKQGDLRDKIFEAYVKQRYLREIRRPNAKNFFSLLEVYDLLGQIAIQDAGEMFIADNRIKHKDILEVLSNKALLTDFVDLVTTLNLLIRLEDGNLRFVHLLLRDYFAFGFARAHLESPERVLRAQSLFALARIGDARIIDSFIATLRGRDHNARSFIAYALGKFKDQRIVTPLIECLNDEHPHVRRNAAVALSRIGDTRAIPPLMALLKHSDRLSRRSAADALGYLGSREAVGAIINLLDDDDKFVRASALNALLRIGTPEALAAVEAWRKSQQQE